MKLSENQEKFVDDAENQGFDIIWDYSGRGMYGAECPAIVIGRDQYFSTKAKVRHDSMGLDRVIYAPN
jgi:hypothetical protein